MDHSAFNIGLYFMYEELQRIMRWISEGGLHSNLRVDKEPKYKNIKWVDSVRVLGTEFAYNIN